MAVLVVLLVLPSYALSRVAEVDGWILIAVPVAISLFTFLAYRSDKHRAQSGAGRIPESTLHGAELLGGWPGGFLGQRVFRHKTSKVSYQIVFWLIISIHQYIALDSILAWKMTKQLGSLLDR